MIIEQVGDIFEEFEAGRINVIAHQCNCMHTMGGGIARIIAERYPEAKEADNKTVRGDFSKLGTYSLAFLSKGRKIVNIYGQAVPSTKERATNYDAIYRGLESLEAAIRSASVCDKYTIGVPYGLASDLAGASWRVIRAMLENIFGDSPVKLVIVRLPTMRELK